MGQGTRVPGQPLNATGLSHEQIIARIPPHTDLIGFSEMFSSDWLVHKRLVRAVHEAFPTTPIILGGEHSSAECDGGVLRLPVPLPALAYRRFHVSPRDLSPRNALRTVPRGHGAEARALSSPATADPTDAGVKADRLARR